MNGPRVNVRRPWEAQEAPRAPQCFIRAAPNAGDYVRAWRAGLALARQGGRIRLFWNSPDLDLEAYRREMLKALDRRINARGGLEPQGRKWEPLYQTELARDCAAIRGWFTLRIRVYSLATPELRRRYGHILAGRDD